MYDYFWPVRNSRSTSTLWSHYWLFLQFHWFCFYFLRNRKLLSIFQVRYWVIFSLKEDCSFKKNYNRLDNILCHVIAIPDMNELIWKAEKTKCRQIISYMKCVQDHSNQYKELIEHYPLSGHWLNSCPKRKAFNLRWLNQA